MSALPQPGRLSAPACTCSSATDCATPAAQQSRRGFLGALTFASAGMMLPQAASAEPAIDSPEAALQALLAGNRRFVSGAMSSCRMPLAPRLRETAEKQRPFAGVLSCADSRVPVEMVFDQELGRLFVARVAGNIATPEVVASLEYGVAVLGNKLIMVLGHGNCGAVKATIAAKAVPGQISSLYQFIRPAVDRAGDHPDAAVRANAVFQARLLASASPVLAKAVGEGSLRVVAAYYDLADGRVSVIES